MLGQIEGLPQVDLDPLLNFGCCHECRVSQRNLSSVDSSCLSCPKCYRPYDLNMPLMIPGRSRLSLKLDSPLTEHGKVCSSIVARDLLHSNILPSRIFCSPELRSVETARCIANKISEESNQIIPVLVEPSLVEWRNFDESETEKHGCLMSSSINWATLDSSAVLRSIVEFLQHVGKDYDGCSILVGSSALAGLVNAQGWRNGQDLHKMRVSVPSCSVVTKCIPSCEHEESSAHGKMRPFTRTLYEARKNRLKK
uniref:Uncharacterized protein n=1 Tax=Ditylenchus dipsaci TaxID=166011 RepID=A0A915DL11_9BILA